MREFYEKSLQKIKSLLKIPTEKEWNTIAKYEGYLSSESLKYIRKRMIDGVREPPYDFGQAARKVRCRQ